MNLPALIENKASSLSERVFDTLKQGIMSLHIKPREYLVIGDIAKEYSVSRTPVREALIRLEQEGWLESDGRRGARVTVPSADVILEAIEVQSALEGYVVRRATALVTDADIQQLTTILDQADQEIIAGNLEDAYQIGDRFHQYLADKVGNRKLKAEISQLQEHIDRVRALIWKHAIIPVEISAQQHRAILSAIQDCNATKAEELMIYHTVWYEKKLASVLEQF
ncbi:MAG: GntR family transcriptional regulator [Cyanobacteria bacterium P01_A01_bin.123]